MKKVEIKSLFDFKFVSMPRFSPDGKYAAFVVQTALYDENKYTGDIWILDVGNKTSRQLTKEGDVKSYIWTKDGNILFSAVRDEQIKEKIKEGEEITCYYEISPENGKIVDSFTLPLLAKNITQTDDGRFIVSAIYDNNRPELEGLSEEERKNVLKNYKNSPCEVIEEVPFWTNGGTFTSGKRNRLYIYNRNTEELVAITDPWFSTLNFDVRKNKLLYKGTRWQKTRVEDIYTGIWVYDLDSKETNCLIEDGKLITAAFALKENEEAILTATEGEIYGVYQYKEFYTLDIKTGGIKKLASYDNTTARNAVNSDARLGDGMKSKMHNSKYYFLTTIDGCGYLKYVDENGVVSDNLTPDGSCDSFDINDEHLLVCGMFENKLAEIYLDGEQVTHFNDEWINNHTLSVPEYHEFTDPDGYEVHGWAMKPVGYEKGRKYPAILHIHGGPRTAFGAIFHHEMQLWANEGYFVFFCNPRGSDGRGSDFGNIKGKFGTVDYENIMQFADCMLKEYPDADESNFGVTGGSYGGFMTNWIIGHTDRFKAAVSQRSISSWITMEHISDIGIWFAPNNQGVSTFDDIDKIWWHSPLKYADKCKTPTLFIHSDADYRCNQVEGISMYTALMMHGCEARMCLFKGENHELSRSGKPQSRIRRLEEILAWFDKHLK